VGTLVHRVRRALGIVHYYLRTAGVMENAVVGGGVW